MNNGTSRVIALALCVMAAVLIAVVCVRSPDVHSPEAEEETVPRAKGEGVKQMPPLANRNLVSNGTADSEAESGEDVEGAEPDVVEVSNHWNVRVRCMTVDGGVVCGASVRVGGELFCSVTDDQGLVEMSVSRKQVEDAAQGRMGLPLIVSCQGFVTERSGVPIEQLVAGDVLEIVLRQSVGLKGLVLDDTGLPVEGAIVRVLLDTLDGSAAVSAVDGRFELSSVSPGRNRLEVFAPTGSGAGLWRQKSVIVEVDSGDPAIEVTLSRVPEKPVAVELPSALRVSVVDGETGQPVHPVEVVLLKSDRLGSASSRSGDGVSVQGNSIFHSGVKAGNWRVWARMPDGAARFVDVIVDGSGAEVVAEIRSGDAGRISGTVHDGTGRVADVEEIEVVLCDGTRVPSFAIGPQASLLGLTSDVVQVRGKSKWRSDSLVPGWYQLESLSERCSILGNVEVLAGKVSQIAMDVKLPSRLVCNGSNRPGSCFLVLVLTVEGTRSSYTVSAKLPAGANWRVSIPAHPGRTVWKGSIRSARDFSRGEDLTRPRTGVLELVSGKGTDLAVESDGVVADE